MGRRQKGSGSIYQRGDGLWCATVEMEPRNGKRRRKVVASKDRAVVVVKLAEAVGDGPGPTKSRAELMRAAQIIATHTPDEWHKKVRESTKICRYCDAALNHFNMVKDHMIAVEAGGSDGIDNVQPICWECNIEKYVTPHDQYIYKGTKPRPFRVFPIRRPEYDRVMEKRASMTGEKGMK